MPRGWPRSNRDADATPSERARPRDAFAEPARPRRPDETGGPDRDEPWWSDALAPDPTRPTRGGPSPANRWDHVPTPEELKERFKKKRRRTSAERERILESVFDPDALFRSRPEDETPPGKDFGRPEGYYYDPEDPWAVLGVDRDASWSEITEAHRALAKQHHPDVLADLSPADRFESEDKMREINIAYSLLRRRFGR